MPHEWLDQHAGRIYRQNDHVLSASGQPFKFQAWLAKDLILRQGAKVRHGTGVGFWDILETSLIVRLPNPAE